MESALISMGPFIATFADSDKTGLYYVGNGMITVHPVKLLEISSRSEKSETNGLSFDSTAVTSSSNSDHTNEDSGVEVSQDQNQTSEPQLDQLFPTLSLQDDLQASSDEKATESASVVGEDVGHQHLTSELDSELALEVESQESVSKSDDTEHDLKEDDLSYSFDEPKDDQTWIDSFSEAIFVAPESQEKDLSQTSSEDFDGEELKSEFGHFLYWREPLPSIEIEIQTQFFHDTQYKQATMEATSSSMFNSHNQGAICSDYSGSDNSNVFYSHLHCSYSNSDPNASQLLNGFDPQDGLCDPANPNSQDKVMGPLSLWTVSSFESANAANDQKYFAQYPDFYQNVQQQLGTIEQDIVPSELLQHFVNMSTNNYMSDLYTTDITYHCAYSLPAVAFTLGSDNWQCLRRTFFNLVRNMSTNIRCILASSLYPIALIIGHEHTSRDLFCAFKLFLVDVDEVRARLVPTFIPFIKLLSAQEREQVLSKLSLFITLENFLNWRFRVTFCEMFQELVPLYTKADHFNQYIIQIVFILLKDKVAEVRNASVKVAGTVVKHLYDLPGLAPMPIQMLEMISDFSKARNWFIRQTFVAFCNHMLYDSVIPLEEFEKQLLSPLLRLALDPVPNVRLTVSRLLGRLPYSDKKELVKRLKVQTAIQMLTSDGDKDVREQLDLYGECRRDFGMSSNHSESCEQQSANMDITHCELSDAGEQQLTIAESSQPIHLETEHQEAGEEEEVNMDYSEMIPNLQDFNGWSADASRMAKPMPDYWKRSLRPTIEKH